MGTELRSRRAISLLVGGLCLTHAFAQHAPHTPAASPAPATSHQDPKSAAEQKRGASTTPTHAPNPNLPPLVALQHIQRGNAAAAEARTHQRELPPPAPRPAGAGRYVCAVLVCCDADVSMHELLGLRREDVFVVSAPGPFATTETLTALERTLLQDHVPLLLVVGHAGCRTLQPRATDATPNALDRRIDDARAQAARGKQPLPKTLVMLQREVVLASSDALQQAVVADTLRVFPAELDDRTWALTWHHQRIDAMPIAPVK